MGFSCSHCVEPYGDLGTAGGLTLWWHQDVVVDILFQSNNMIDTFVIIPGDRKCFRATWLYGPPVYANRRSFWEDMKNLDWKDDKPWVCAGDFNEFLWQDEKQGGTPCAPNRRSFLRDFMDANSLIDPGFKGHRFTWIQRRDDTINMQERLDRFMFNVSRVKAWPNSCVFHGPFAGSDHCPVILNSDPILKKGVKPFRFESFSADDPECASIVQEGWEAELHGDNSLQWSKKLNLFKEKLRKWSNERFGNNRKKIDSLMAELLIAQEKMDVSTPLTNVDAITVELNEAWQREE